MVMILRITSNDQISCEISLRLICDQCVPPVYFVSQLQVELSMAIGVTL
jgi:hypothetical protein